MQDSCTTAFAFSPATKGGEGTHVNWHMFGERNFMAKGFCLFMDMDKMVGGDFEKGLASLKAVCEAKAKEPPPADSGNKAP